MKPLTLRTRLTLVYTGSWRCCSPALGVRLSASSCAQLNLDATARLEEITRGLHGYLRFADGIPSLAYHASDPEEVGFIEEATRYYQVFDADTGRLLVESPR